jgi:outer membrane protein OmpA-like peptidoglycan-associated protein
MPFWSPAMIRTFTAIALAACSFATSAQDAVHYREGDRIDPHQVARILAAQPMKTRSIRLLDAPGNASPSQSTAASLSLPVRFAFDSTEIAPSARPQLDALANGIKLLPPQQSVVIEGHTDAAGGEQYNQALSERRALMVKRYLVQVHGIEMQRLKDTGYGKQRPIEGIDPHAADNRRVQFRGG